ncbi:MAG: VOC family protein [Jatrophihabitantaceae bacterium]
MTERKSAWPAGTPCWVDLMTSDIDAARLFYEGLFGWQLTVGPPETGGYTMAELDHLAVAGLGPIQPGQDGHPSVWTTYLASDDVGATAKAITRAGGTVVAEPFDVMDLGVMGAGKDPTGATFGFWQAGKHTGAQLVNVTNTLVWNEVMTREYQAAMNFYAAVFGYSYSDMGGDGFQYSTIELDGNTVGGIGALPEDVPEQVPAHWRTYFAVDDADEAVDSVVRLGGTVLRPPQDMPYGRHADVADPQGAAFAVIKPAQPS